MFANDRDSDGQTAVSDFRTAACRAQALAARMHRTVWVRRCTGGWQASLSAPSRSDTSARISAGSQLERGSDRIGPSAHLDRSMDLGSADTDFDPASDDEDDQREAEAEARREAQEEVWSGMDEYARDAETGWAYSDQDDPPW